MRQSKTKSSLRMNLRARLTGRVRGIEATRYPGHYRAYGVFARRQHTDTSTSVAIPARGTACEGDT